MSNITKNFILTGFLFLAAGVTLGALLTINSVREMLVSSTPGIFLAHSHINIFGFIFMVIFGVNYHYIPIFSNRPMYSEKWAGYHFYMMIVGVIGMVIGLALLSRAGIVLFAIFEAAGAYLFMFNIIKTFTQKPQIDKEPLKDERYIESDRIAVRFTRLSTPYLILGTTLTIFISLMPDGYIRFRPIIYHTYFLGWISMMIFGVGYHILPRFADNKIHSLFLMRLNLKLANIGVAGFVFSWLLGIFFGSAFLSNLRHPFGILAASALFIFVYNIWRSVFIRSGHGVK
ncbi:MAG: cbb3-type cytochrome c oxidase subunit I [Nitrospirae bacterium]|nr:cbb3-type cytochrome c oxidase subunit I [Nitrospirota bacterium]